MRQPVPRAHGIGNEETREAPVGATREARGVVAVQAGGRVGRIAQAMEAQLLDHQPRDDLRLARLLERRLHGMQFLLPDEESEQPDVDPVQVVVHVAQPLVLVLVLAVALRLVEEHRHDTAAIAGAGVLDPVDQLQPLGRIAPLVRLGTATASSRLVKKGPSACLGLCSACT